MKLVAWQSVLTCGLAVVLAWAGGSLAAERVTIGQLHQYHKSYNMRAGTVVGKVAEMQAFPPMPVAIGRCRTLYGKAQFVLVDDTGSLSVESVGSCFEAAMHLPHDGDLIQLTTEILVYIREGQTTEVMKALTREIVILK